MPWVNLNGPVPDPFQEDELVREQVREDRDGMYQAHVQAEADEALQEEVADRVAEDRFIRKSEHKSPARRLVERLLSSNGRDK